MSGKNLTLQVRARGTLTIPADLRQKYAIEEGDVYTVVDLGDGTLILAPRISIVSKLVAEIERHRVEAGVSIDELLAGGQEERQRIYDERYRDRF